ncbi:CLUMA_CG011882, isoform A [Clunio marinus]|uniref:CLUMA_CG011882, isoform A n=1 Tax=Clunio marinus TaxID=568069 RepID=A0A1J1IJB0_9DIPT|nr:CLUMA_CG011882, isoform A [Clunio marinus]
MTLIDIFVLTQFPPLDLSTIVKTKTIHKVHNQLPLDLSVLNSSTFYFLNIMKMLLSTEAKRSCQEREEEKKQATHGQTIVQQITPQAQKTGEKENISWKSIETLFEFLVINRKCKQNKLRKKVLFLYTTTF